MGSTPVWDKKESNEENASRFPYVLNLKISHNSHDWENDKINFDYSFFLIEGMDKCFKEMNKYNSFYDLTFSFKFPLSKDKFEELKDTLEFEGYFFRKEEFIFKGNITISGINKNDLMSSKYYSSQFKLQLDLDKNNSFKPNTIKTFSCSTFLTGSYMTDFLGIENSDKQGIYFNYINDRSSPDFEYYIDRVLPLVTSNLDKIISSKNEALRDKYITEDLNDILKLVIHHKEKTIGEHYKSELSNLVINEFVSEKFSNFNSYSLTDLFKNAKFGEKTLCEFFTENPGNLLISFSSWGISSGSYDLLDVVRKNEECKDSFKETITDLNLIRKCLTRASKIKYWKKERISECHILLFCFLVSDVRKILYDNFAELSLILKNDILLGPYVKTIEYLLKIEFEGQTIFKQIIKGEINGETPQNCHKILLEFKTIQNYMENLMYLKDMGEDNLITAVYKKVGSLKEGLFEMLQQLIEGKNSNKIEEYLNEYLNKWVDDNFNYSKCELNFEQLSILFDPIFKSFFTLPKNKVFIEIINKQLKKDNCQQIFESKFEVLCYYYNMNYLHRNWHQEMIEKLIKENQDLSSRFTNLYNIEYLTDYLKEFMQSEEYDIKNVDFILSFPEIKALLDSNIENMKVTLNHIEKFRILYELRFVDTQNICFIPFNTVSVFRIDPSKKSAYCSDSYYDVKNLNNFSKSVTLTCKKNIPVVFKQIESKSFYVTHICIGKPGACASSPIKTALFLGGVGELPNEEELSKFYDFNDNINDFSRFIFLGLISFESHEKSTVKSKKSMSLQKIEFVTIIILDKFGNYDDVDVGGLGCFGSYSEEEANLIFSQNFEYLGEKLR